jgi:hypothetical protein
MLYFDKKDLSQYFDPDGVRYYEGRGEIGLCLHLPLKGYVAGASPGEDYMLMMAVANDLIEFLRYKRAAKGPEAWDYDAEKAAEVYTVCGDNPSIAGIIIFDRDYAGGAKLQVFLDKTFGSNEVAIRWKNQMVGDERLMEEYAAYMVNMLRNGTDLRSES